MSIRADLEFLGLAAFIKISPSRYFDISESNLKNISEETIDFWGQVFQKAEVTLPSDLDDIEFTGNKIGDYMCITIKLPKPTDNDQSFHACGILGPIPNSDSLTDDELKVQMDLCPWHLFTLKKVNESCKIAHYIQNENLSQPHFEDISEFQYLNAEQFSSYMADHIINANAIKTTHCTSEGNPQQSEESLDQKEARTTDDTALHEAILKYVGSAEHKKFFRKDKAPIKRYIVGVISLPFVPILGIILLISAFRKSSQNNKEFKLRQAQMKRSKFVKAYPLMINTMFMRRKINHSYGLVMISFDDQDATLSDVQSYLNNINQRNSIAMSQESQELMNSLFSDMDYQRFRRREIPLELTGGKQYYACDLELHREHIMEIEEQFMYFTCLAQKSFEKSIYMVPDLHGDTLLDYFHILTGKYAQKLPAITK